MANICMVPLERNNGSSSKHQWVVGGKYGHPRNGFRNLVGERTETKG